MEIISVEYTKQRKDFGAHPAFVDSDIRTESLAATDYSSQWAQSAVTTTELDCIGDVAYHEVCAAW